MRLLQIVTRPQRRGAEVFASELSRELERRGHPVATAYLYAAPEPRLPLRPGDLALDGDERSGLERAPGFQPGLVVALRRAVASFGPDVVQVNGSRTVKYGSLLRRLDRRAPWALVYRSIGTPSDWLRGPLHKALVRRVVMSQMDGVVAVSRATLEDLARCYRLEVPAVAIPRGVDPERFAPAAPREAVRRAVGADVGAPVLLYVGSLTAEKRLDRLIRVAAAVADRRVALGGAAPELWIAGDGPLRNEVETAAAGAAPAVRVLGARADVADLMGAADLLLLTSDTEGMPGVVLEAACVGLPAVATRVGGTGEAIVDGETGVLVDPADEAGAAEAVAALLADPERRRALGAAARRRVQREFSIGPIAERYLAHYERVRAHRADRRAGGR